MAYYLFPVASRSQFTSPLAPDDCLQRLTAHQPAPGGPAMRFSIAERGSYSVLVGLHEPGHWPLGLGAMRGEVLIQNRLDGRSEVSGFVLHRAPTVIAVWTIFAAIAGTFYALGFTFTRLWAISLAIIYVAAFVLLNNWLIDYLRRERQAILNALERLLEGPVKPR